jgi:hypothetical protein
MLLSDILINLFVLFDLLQSITISFNSSIIIVIFNVLLIIEIKFHFWLRQILFLLHS